MPGWWYLKIQHIILFLKGAGSQLAASFFTMQLEKLLVNEKKSQLHVNQTCLPSIASNITSHKSELWKTGCSISIFFKFVHQCLFLYLVYYLYLLLAFWAVIFMFRSIWIFINFATLQLPLGITASCRVEKQPFGGAVLFGGSLLLLSCGNDWRKCGAGRGGTPIHYPYGYVPPNGVMILKLLI